MRAPLKNYFKKLAAKFFVGRRGQKRSPAGLREHFDNAITVEKFEPRTQWELEIPSRSNSTERGCFIHESSYADDGCKIGEGTKIWHFCHIMPGAKIGRNCSIGQNVNIGNKALIGNGVKIQNNVSIYDNIILEDDVFCGPSCVFTNVINPRAFVIRKNEYRETVVKKGASIGANATIVCGVTLGEYCFIGAGATVTMNVMPYSVVYGNPARHRGWVCKCGEMLGSNLLCFNCKCGASYLLKDNSLIVKDSMGES